MLSLTTPFFLFLPPVYSYSLFPCFLYHNWKTWNQNYMTFLQIQQRCSDTDSSRGGSQKRRGWARWDVCPKCSFLIWCINFFRFSLGMSSKEALRVNCSLKHYFQCHYEVVTFFLVASHDLFIVLIFIICLVWHSIVYQKNGND